MMQRWSLVPCQLSRIGLVFRNQQRYTNYFGFHCVFFVYHDTCNNNNGTASVRRPHKLKNNVVVHAGSASNNAPFIAANTTRAINIGPALNQHWSNALWDMSEPRLTCVWDIRYSIMSWWEAAGFKPAPSPGNGSAKYSGWNEGPLQPDTARSSAAQII